MRHPQPVLDYFARVGAEILNFRRAMVKSYRGHYYIERALIKIASDGVVSCSNKEFAPTKEEVAAMKAALEGVEFPRTIGARSTEGLKVAGEIFEFWDIAREEILMVQERRTHADGTKSYIPWTFLSTGEWASMEPDNALPFWKPPEITPRGARIMIHEGAKSARAASELTEDHPWYEELIGYHHWGMVGGALAPHRTDYQELKSLKPREVVYVCDNDRPGEQALQKISKYWGKSLRGVRFGMKFPPSWDLADPMPKSLFAPNGRYIGPRFIDMMRPATWATEKLDSGKIIIKSEFAEEWMHCVTPDVFVHKDHPNKLLNLNEFNNTVAPFSHVDETGKILKRDCASKAAILRYVPGEAPGIHSGTEEQDQYINTFVGTAVRCEQGDPAPWLDFLSHLVPDESDREELMRWCATLIARPEMRMLYGVLMISETQGVGKGTLGEKILAPLVGHPNVSYPSEQEIVESQYNYWLAHKRLAVVHEIYAGHSSKAYNKLKSIITDQRLTVQKKYQANYEIENWIHVFACSNSLRAMKLSVDDRRWFVPRVTEECQPREYWNQLNEWLRWKGGLGIIRQWAEEWVRKNGCVDAGAAAPWSSMKQEVVEEGYSPGQQLVNDTLNALRSKIEKGELPPDTFVLDVQLVDLIKNQLWEGRHNDRLERPLTVRKVAKSCGWLVGERRAHNMEAWNGYAGGRIISLSSEIAAARPTDLAGDAVEEPFRKKPLDLNAAARF